VLTINLSSTTPEHLQIGERRRWLPTVMGLRILSRQIQDRLNNNYLLTAVVHKSRLEKHFPGSWMALAIPILWRVAHSRTVAYAVSRLWTCLARTSLRTHRICNREAWDQRSSLLLNKPQAMDKNLISQGTSAFRSLQTRHLFQWQTCQKNSPRSRERVHLLRATRGTRRTRVSTDSNHRCETKLIYIDSQL
jgi:hypothetical protein